MDLYQLFDSRLKTVPSPWAEVIHSIIYPKPGAFQLPDSFSTTTSPSKQSELYALAN